MTSTCPDTLRRDTPQPRWDVWGTRYLCTHILFPSIIWWLCRQPCLITQFHYHHPHPGICAAIKKNVSIDSQTAHFFHFKSLFVLLTSSTCPACPVFHLNNWYFHWLRCYWLTVYPGPPLMLYLPSFAPAADQPGPEHPAPEGRLPAGWDSRWWRPGSDPT